MERIEYGVILAAGEGVRMQPLTTYFPKVTLPILDKPLLIHHFDIMKMLGIKKVFIVVQESRKELIETIIDVDPVGLEYELVIQDFPRGTGHAILPVEDKIDNKRFLLLLGDEYYNDTNSFKEMGAEAGDGDMVMGIIEYDNPENIKAGCNVHLRGSHVARLVEKPKQDEIVGKWCWDGSVVLDSRIFTVLRGMAGEGSPNVKDSLCIVNAMQIMLERDAKIKAVKKRCDNINMTYVSDYMKAGLIEFKKKYGVQEIINLCNEVAGNGEQ